MKRSSTRRDFRTWAALFSVALLAACGGSDDPSGALTAPAPTPPPPPTPAPPPPAAPTADLKVTVADTQGRFVEGAVVTVVSSGAAATTNASGDATVRLPAGSEQAVRVEKAGFAEQVQLVALAAGATQGRLITMLVARAPAIQIAAIESGGSATGQHGVKVEFPPGALVDPNGQPVTGAIDVLMTPLNTAQADVRAFPGSFEGTAPGVARTPIVTFGTSELVPQQNGQKLRLAPNRSATIELPLYANKGLDGAPIRAGDRIPLWSLDPSSGLWAQEGEGTVITQPASPTGMAMRADISHFSWWNIDRFAERGTANITVRAVGSTPPANISALLEAQVIAGSGPTSTASRNVVVGTATPVQVASPGTLRFTARFEFDNQSCFGSAEATVPSGATVDVLLSANCVTVPQPTIVVPSGTVGTNSSRPVRVQIDVDGRQPDTVQLLANGVPVASFGPQFFYVHQLDTSGLPEGTVPLTARATLEGSSRTSAPVNVIVDRTPPQISNLSPATTTQVSRTTTFTVTFDESVNPGLFPLTDAVRLSLTPAGQTTPVPIAATMVLDAAGTQLTVTPTVDIGPGIVGLAWGGLRDIADNSVTGTVAASWAVDRTTTVGAAIPSNFSGMFGTPVVSAGVMADGSLRALHRPLPEDNLILSRYDGAANAWLPASPAINDRPLGTTSMAVFALDANDVPYVAFIQPRAADSTLYELVLKRLVNGSWESAAPPVLLNGTRSMDMSPGEMAFDGSNRPIIAFADPDLGRLHVLRLESGALVPLGGGAFQQLAGDITLRISASGTVFVSYLQGFFGSNAVALTVAAFNGTSWTTLPVVDSTPNATENIVSPRLALVGNEPWIALNHFGGVRDGLWVYRFNGTAWVTEPFAPPLARGAGALDLATISGRPTLATYRDDGTTLVSRHDGTAWSEPFDATGANSAPALRLVQRDSTVLLVASNRLVNQALVQRLTIP